MKTIKTIIKPAYKKIMEILAVRQKKIKKNNITKPLKNKFLMFMFCAPNTPQAAIDPIKQLVELSDYPIDVINIYPNLCLEKNFNFNKYDGLIFHNTVNYFIENQINIDKNCNQRIKDFKGLKIVYKQDEHFRHNKFLDYIEEYDVDMVITICDDDIMDSFYPVDRFPKLKKLTNLTAYVTDYYKNLPYKNINNRNIDVGYRGSIQPLVAGRLCYEKRQIGWEFEKYAKLRGLKTDISSESKDRIFGDKWYGFLGNCKAVLGVESGTDMVDLDGSVEKDYNEYMVVNPNASDEEVLNALAKHEQGVKYRAISPRHFEAAACFAVQVMYEGRFQDIFRANEHYIPLKRDYSNVDEVIDKLLDDKIRKEICERAYEEIILNPIYGYPYFIKNFDCAVADLLK